MELLELNVKVAKESYEAAQVGPALQRAIARHSGDGFDVSDIGKAVMEVWDSASDGFKDAGLALDEWQENPAAVLRGLLLSVVDGLEPYLKSE